jgi:hypothetical protein
MLVMLCPHPPSSPVTCFPIPPRIIKLFLSTVEWRDSAYPIASLRENIQVARFRKCEQNLKLTFFLYWVFLLFIETWHDIHTHGVGSESIIIA